VTDEAQHKLVLELVGAIADRDAPLIRTLLRDEHPADIADAIEQLNGTSKRHVCQLCPDLVHRRRARRAGRGHARGCLRRAGGRQIAEALEDLDSDDMTHVVEDLDEDKRAAVLAAVSDEDRQSLEASFAFEEETAGRLMQREFVAAPSFWTVGQTIDHMRKAGEDLPDLFFEVFVVDEMFKPVGAVPVSALMRSQRERHAARSDGSGQHRHPPRKMTRKTRPICLKNTI
jgi:magnesium transporter